MTKLITLPNSCYVNLANATSFSIEKRYTLCEKAYVCKFLFWKFDDFKIIRRPTYCFVVNGEVVYEAMADDPAEMRFIENIKKCITGFIRK